MGYGRWDDDTYRAARTYRAASGEDDFARTAAMQDRDRREWRADPALDPFGVGLRESRDSAEHADSLPIAVLFDVTGSMGVVPRIVQRKLSRLHGLLRDREYARDPQLLFGGIGDAESDRVPLQVGQFESDNRMDEQLRSIFLEGGGSGQKSESYELAAYFMARHVVTDAWERRAHKGYLFVVGDEMNKSRVSARHVARVIGDEIGHDLDVRAVYRELQRRWHVFFVLPGGTHYYDDEEIARHWRSLLGHNLLRLADPGAVCELIAAVVGVGERGLRVDQVCADLRELDSGAESRAVGAALAQR
jgi:hypothetical protein